MKKHYLSVFEKEQEILKAILELHINEETFELDPMFFKGTFYKTIPKPLLISDLRGKELGIKTMDATKMELNNNSIDSMILDPPFIICSDNNKYGAKKYSFYKNEKELILQYNLLLKEAFRVLRKKGICVFKCQDFTNNKTLMTHCLVYNLAIENGFYVKDLAILNNIRNKPANHNLQQRHFRKSHTYFWVLEKR